MELTYRTFDELELELGKDWTKDETEAPSGVCVIFTRTWPCGCMWSQSLGLMTKSKDEWLFPCAAHAAAGFHVDFRDETWRASGAMYAKTRHHKGKVVTPEMLPKLTVGQIIRARSRKCTELHPDDPMVGATNYVVDSVDPVVLRTVTGGMVETIGRLSEESLADNDVRLVSRGDETWPTGPTWVLKDLESVNGRK